MITKFNVAGRSTLNANFGVAQNRAESHSVISGLGTSEIVI
jgi:hypothetical protein